MSPAALRLSFAAAVAACCAIPPASARSPFEMDITIGSTQQHFSFNAIDRLLDQLDPARLRDAFAAESPDTNATLVMLDFRGLETRISFAADSSRLFFQVGPNGAVLSRQFGDPSPCNPLSPPEACRLARKQAIDQLRDFLKTNKDGLRQLLTALARFSPVDPLAGNPDSLFGRRMKGDFDHGFTHKVSQVWGCGTTAFQWDNDEPFMVAAVGGVSDIFADAQARAAALHAQNEITWGAQVSSTTAESASGDYRTTGLVFPFSYTAKMDFDPGHKLRVDLPLTYTDTDGAASYSFGFGLAYTYPVSDVWTLTPAIGVGATGSEDLGSAGGVSAYSLTSAYTWRLGGYALSMGNSVGQYDSLGLKFGDIEAEADVSNTVYTNGLMLTGPNSLLASNLVLEYFIQDTQITGDAVYADQFDEIGVALGYIGTEMGVIDSYLKFGLSYMVGEGAAGDINVVKLSLTSRF